MNSLDLRGKAKDMRELCDQFTICTTTPQVEAVALHIEAIAGSIVAAMQCGGLEDSPQARVPKG